MVHNILLEMSDDDGEEVVFESDQNEVIDSPIEVAAKRRGEGRLFDIVAHHDSLRLAIAAMKSNNNHATTRVKGCNIRGRTASYYWQFSYNTCGCTKERRISTNLYTSDVICTPPQISPTLSTSITSEVYKFVEILRSFVHPHVLYENCQ